MVVPSKKNTCSRHDVPARLTEAADLSRFDPCDIIPLPRRGY
jgi:hypothetical protein